jgi:hypothetical protein
MSQIDAYRSCVFSGQLGRGVTLPPLARELVECHLALFEHG